MGLMQFQLMAGKACRGCDCIRASPQKVIGDRCGKMKKALQTRRPSKSSLAHQNHGRCSTRRTDQRPLSYLAVSPLLRCKIPVVERSWYQGEHRRAGQPENLFTGLPNDVGNFLCSSCVTSLQRNHFTMTAKSGGNPFQNREFAARRQRTECHEEVEKHEQDSSTTRQGLAQHRNTEHTLQQRNGT